MIAVHGSMRRDLDVIAIPWVELATSPEELIAAIGIAVGNPQEVHKPGWKPHGRLSWSILLWNAKRSEQDVLDGYVPWIDISVMPRRNPNEC